MRLKHKLIPDDTISAPYAEWKDLTEASQIDELLQQSLETPVVIFKFSTRCNLSNFMLKKFEKKFDLENDIGLYFLSVRENREASDAVASRFSLIHETPQLLLLKNGRAVYYANHENIKYEDFTERL